MLLTLLRTNAAGVAIRFAGAPVWMLGYIFVSGAVAITAMVLPGISGSTLLLIAGVYLPAIGAIKAFLGLDFSVMQLPCLDYFMAHFLDSFQLTLDELE